MSTQLQAHDARVESLRQRAGIARRCNALEEAGRLLEKALELSPQNLEARAEYARVLIAAQRYSQARTHAESLLALQPDSAAYRLLRATVYAGLAEHEQAIALYRQLLAELPHWPEGQVLLGHSLKAIGEASAAVKAYRGAAAARADFGDAYWSLANLKTYRFSAPEIEAMLRAESAAQDIDRLHFCFALGKAFEDCGDYRESWRFYQRGNALKLAGSRYRPEFTEVNTHRQIDCCTAAFFSERAGYGAPDPDPIFIVGLPRAGSTMVEQLLASHAEVDGTQELFELQRIVLELQGPGADARNPRYPAVLRGMSCEDSRRLGARYLSETRPFRRGKPLFIDKMPNNFRHIGLIHLLLPHAKIIDVRREPMACCFGNFKQLFASGQDFTYGIENIARYYRSYLQLMRHWDSVLPGRVLRVHYEDLVEDLPRAARRIFEFCDLEFAPRCLEFHKTRRAVSTASSEQVRQPLFRTGLSHWRHYESWLGPLRDRLGDAVVRYRD